MFPNPFPFTLYNVTAETPTPPSSTCDFTYCYGGDWVQGYLGNPSGTGSLGGTGSYAMSFDSSDSPKNYIDINNFSDIHALQSGTISMWINPNISGESYPTLVGAGDNAVANTYFHFYIDHTDSKVKYALYNGGTNNTNIYNNTAITANAWNHVALVSDGAEAKIYLNGVDNTLAVASKNAGDWFADASGLDNLTLGILEYNGSTLFGPFSGSMDEVAFWNVPLSSSTITELYNNGSGSRADSIVPPPATTGSFSAGKVGNYSLEFDGTNQSVTASDLSSYYTNKISVACWFKPNETGRNQAIASEYQWGGTNRGWELRFGSANTIDIFATENGGFTGNYISLSGQGTTLSTGTWYHIVADIDASTPTAKVYINGALSHFGGGQGSGFNIRNSTQPYSLGTIYNNLGNNDELLNGQLDEVAIWNVSLDSGAASSLYNNGTGTIATNVSSSNLFVYYNFEDGPGNTIIQDRTSNNIDGTLINMDTGSAGELMLYYDFEGGPGTSALVDRSNNNHTGSLTNMDAGGITTLKMYYDFEIGESNPVSGNFPTSTTVYDVVTSSYHGPTAHTGTMTNMAVADFGDWTQGKRGKYSIELGGGSGASVRTDSSIEIPYNASQKFTGTDEFTVACWVKVNPSIDLQGIVSHNNHTPSFNGWLLGFRAGVTPGLGNGFNFGTRNASLSPNTVYTSNTTQGTLSADTWYHVVGVRDGTTNRLYVNATASASPTTMASIGDPGNIRIRIGQWYEDADNYGLFGNVDDVCLWNVPLSASDVISLYNGGYGVDATTISSSNIVGYYKMETDGPGNTSVTDSSSTGNDATLTGTSISAGTCGAG